MRCTINLKQIGVAAPIDGRVNSVPAIDNGKTTLSAEVGATKTFDFALVGTPGK